MNVAILGASQDPSRYAYLAFQLLRERGHSVFPVHPSTPDIDGVKVFRSLIDIPVVVHTLTLYVNKERSLGLIPEILKMRPSRIIFNPGAENEVLWQAAQDEGIGTVKACTLVLLRTGQF